MAAWRNSSRAPLRPLSQSHALEAMLDLQVSKAHLHFLASAPKTLRARNHCSPKITSPFSTPSANPGISKN